MEFSFSELCDRLDEIKQFAHDASEFLLSNPPDHAIRELYQITRSWVEFSFVTLCGFEELRSLGHDDDEVTRKIAQLSITTQALLIAADEFLKVYDPDRVPRHIDDLQ